MPQTVEKQAIPVIKDKDNEPVAIIYFSPNRERIIYVLRKADEDEIVTLLSIQNNPTSSFYKLNTNSIPKYEKTNKSK